MLKKYIYIFLISMVPLIELRGAVPVSQVMGLPIVPSFIVCIIANMLPVPIIYLFARKVLIWGADKPIIGKFFSFCLEKGEKGGKKLQAKAGRGLFVALLLFVGIHFREQVHGQEHLRQVSLIWISSQQLPLSCLEYCLPA